MTDFGRRSGSGDMLKSVYDTNEDGVVDAAAATAAHKTSHQNGGTDEISVVGLSGELADNQPPKAHALGSASHSAATLAEVNAKVSDATLDKNTDTRTPAAHKTSHQNGGTDEISLTGLDGKSLFVDRGDPSAADWAVGDLTTDGAYHDLVCSGVVPAGATAIQFRVYLDDDAAASYFLMRNNGRSNAINLARVSTQVANIPIDGVFFVPCDANRVVEYATTNTTFNAIYIIIMGWLIG